MLIGMHKPGLSAAGASGYRYLKLNMTASNATYLSLFALGYYDGGVWYPTQTMTTNSAPSPLVASATNTFAAYDPWRVFDQNAGSVEWLNDATLPSLVKIDLGAGNGITPARVRISPNLPDSPSAFTVEGSNDDSAWTVLYTTSGVTTGWTTATYREFVF